MLFILFYRESITQTYLNLCEELGEYNQLKKMNQKFRARIKIDGKDNVPGTESTSKRGAPAAGEKQKNQNKNIERRINKRICLSMLKALRTKVDELYNEFVTPNDQNVNKYSKQPLLTLSNKDDLPEILRETFEIYNKFTRKEFKKTTTQVEKDILFDCVFKMRCIYDGMIYQRLLNMSKQYQADAAEECNEWFKQLKINHESAKKEHIKDELSKNEQR